MKTLDNNGDLVDESYPLLLSLPPSLQKQLEETLEIQMIKIKTVSDQDIKKMKVKMAYTFDKVTNSLRSEFREYVGSGK